MLAPSWSSVGDLVPLPLDHHHSDRRKWEKPALSLLLCRFLMLISFMSGTGENRKTYIAWKHPFKISHSFSELKNDWKKFSSARHPSDTCFWTSGHFHGLWLSQKTKLDSGSTTLLVDSHSQFTSSQPVFKHDLWGNVVEGLLLVEPMDKNSLFD